MSKLKEMLTEVENRLGSILNGVVVNEKGYLEYREKAPRYSKWSFSYRERLEKEILKHYINRDEVEEIKEKYYRGKEITENGQRFLVVEGKKLPFGWPYPTTKEEYILKELNKTNKEDKT